MKTLTSINEAIGRRVGISFNMDNAQTTVFLSQEEFLNLMAQVFDYRDAHKEELQKTIQRQQKRIKLLEKNQATASRLEAIRESVATISVQPTEKQKRADCIDTCLGRIEKFLDILEKED